MQTMEIGLGELLGGMGRRGPEMVDLTIEQKLAMLTTAQARYDLGNPWSVGDVVTPAANTPLNAIGEPHIVVEVNEYDEPDFSMGSQIECGDSRFGTRYQVRVMSVNAYGATLCHWVEAWMLEAYEAPTTEAGPTAGSFEDQVVTES